MLIHVCNAAALTVLLWLHTAVVVVFTLRYPRKAVSVPTAGRVLSGRVRSCERELRPSGLI